MGARAVKNLHHYNNKYRALQANNCMFFLTSHQPITAVLRQALRYVNELKQWIEKMPLNNSVCKMGHESLSRQFPSVCSKCLIYLSLYFSVVKYAWLNMHTVVKLHFFFFLQSQMDIHAHLITTLRDYFFFLRSKVGTTFYLNCLSMTSS